MRPVVRKQALHSASDFTQGGKCFTICFTICLFISPDLDGHSDVSRYVSRYVCSLVRTRWAQGAGFHDCFTICLVQLYEASYHGMFHDMFVH